jgi:hypothetical protein
MMVISITKWHCDLCNEMIDGTENGYVIWKQNSEMKSFGFKIVHKLKCDQKDHTSSCALGDVVGLDGLAKLLSHLSHGPIKRNLGQSQFTDAADIDEFVDFIRRVQTPYYEHARRKFSNSDLLSDFSDSNEIYPYIEENLKKIAVKY